jgi:GH24 family phage-related lysozyme (muramidase)
MQDRLKTRFRDHIAASEGWVGWPYLDGKGLVTIGPGLLILGRTPAETRRTFLDLALEIEDGGTPRPATETEKDEAYAVLVAEQARGAGNRAAAAYRPLTRVRLSLAEQTRLLDRQIETRVNRLRAELAPGAWERLGAGQQAAVLDIHYANGSLSRFPRLKAAIARGDAAAMAAEAEFHSGGRIDRGRQTRNRAAILGAAD